MKKRILSILCVLALCLTLLPAAALAAETGRQYLALGDSITTGYGLGEGEQSFAQRVAAGGGYTLANEAAVGATTETLLEKLGTITDQVKAADLITLTIGGNDLMNALYSYLAASYNQGKEEEQQLTAEAIKTMLTAGTADTQTLGTLAGYLPDFAQSSQAAAALLAVTGNLTRIAAAIKQVNQDVTLLVVNQYNPYQYLADSVGGAFAQVRTIADAFDAGVQALNTAIRTVAAGTGSFTVVDAYQVFAAAVTREINPCNAAAAIALPPTLNLDFHPNQTGHKLLAEAVDRTLLSLEHGSHSGWTALTADVMTLTSGKYYLAGDVTYPYTDPESDDPPITVTGDVTLCLNGKNLDINGNYLALETGATLTICDCSNETTEGRLVLDGTPDTSSVEANSDKLWKAGAGTENAYCLTGGVISNGQGLDIPIGTACTMTGGNLAGNSADYGGAVLVSGGRFVMTGGTIAGNTAIYGGGMYVCGMKENADSEYTPGVFAMSGGTIAYNWARNYSGGGYFTANGRLELKGDADIRDNTQRDGEDGNLYLSGSGTAILTGAMTNTAKLGVTLKASGVITQGWSRYMGDADPKDYFVSEMNPGLGSTVSLQNGEAAASQIYRVTFHSNGGSDVPAQAVPENGQATRPQTDPTREGYTFTGWYDDETCATLFDFTAPIDWNCSIYAGWKLDSSPFTDVQEGSWFYDEVLWAYENDVMDGVGGGKFDPNGTVTRAMVWTVLARMDGQDVSGSDWMDQARTWAMAEGVSDGTMATGSVTREQLATMLYRYLGEPEVQGTLSGYPDGAQTSDWAETALIWATEKGVVTNMDGKLNPKGSATRAQLATMLMRFSAVKDA